MRRGENSGRRRPLACRAGFHRYGEANHVGGGIQRQVCTGCGAVTIDLTSVDDLHSTLESSNRTLISLVTQEPDESGPV